MFAPFPVSECLLPAANPVQKRSCRVFIVIVRPRHQNHEKNRMLQHITCSNLFQYCRFKIINCSSIKLSLFIDYKYFLSASYHRTQQVRHSGRLCVPNECTSIPTSPAKHENSQHLPTYFKIRCCEQCSIKILHEMEFFVFITKKFSRKQDAKKNRARKDFMSSRILFLLVA